MHRIAFQKLVNKTFSISEFIARRAKARGIELPSPASELRSWLHDKKVENLKQNADATLASNSSKNWPVFDFCNQFLQTEEELRVN